MANLPIRIALVLNGLGMILIYPLNMLILERSSWIWDDQMGNMPMEHMLVAVYVTLGMFLVWAARDPVKTIPIVDFATVSKGPIIWSALHVNRTLP